MNLAPTIMLDSGVLVFDIEADNLYNGVTKCHCIVAENPNKKGDVESFRPYEIEKGLDYLSKAKCLVGHNIIDYDLPALEKLFGWTYDGMVFDTLVASRLLNPDLFGGHSLKAWGKRLGSEKLDFIGDESVEEAFEIFTEDMLTYCVQDVAVNTLLYKTLALEIYGRVLK